MDASSPLTRNDAQLHASFAISLLCKELTKLSVALAFQFIEVNKTHGGRVDAVAQSASLEGPVGEDVSKVAVGMRRTYLSLNHTPAHIPALDDVAGLDRLNEARPSRAAVKLVKRGEERLARDDVHVNSGLFVVPILVLERPFGPVLLRESVLFRGESEKASGFRW